MSLLIAPLALSDEDREEFDRPLASDSVGPSSMP
jgi:hypothetical protein